jgi:hypothetical protein
MKTFWPRFNIYLLAALALATVSGCRTPEGTSKHQDSTLRIHLEVKPDGTDHNKPVPIFRDNPIMVNIETEPFLTEAMVMEARVIDAVGGFALRIKFDQPGTWLLEQYTASNVGRRLVIFSQFVTPSNDKLNVGRWLAAQIISHRVGDGVLLFTPDVSKEEANSIVRGLNNVAKKNETDKEKDIKL